ncbi:hypothetical protein [Peribacillus sp.]|uniref:hypothetical protein n=1 Tax=Peribacillus sp. TaxID=2675267 RepID=UPI00388F6BA1
MNPRIYIGKKSSFSRQSFRAGNPFIGQNDQYIGQTWLLSVYSTYLSVKSSTLSVKPHFSKQKNPLQ